MIKILFLIHDLGHGGAEKVLVNLVNNMDSQKFDITVMALFGGGINEQFLKPHIRYRKVFAKPFPGNSHIMKIFSSKTLHKWFIKEHYDIEVAYLEGPAARIVSGCPEGNTKLISWIHIEQKNTKSAAASFRSVKEATGCYNSFNKIIAVSQTVKRDFLSILSIRVPVEVLYNTNENRLILEMAQEEIDIDLNNEKVKLVGVGKLVDNKGFDRMLRVVNRLKGENYGVVLLVLGIGSKQQELEQYVRDNSLSDTVTFLGYQTNPYKYVAKCDMFICASHAEGFSTATTEALIVGTPVCTVEVSGMKEMLGDNNEWGIVTENDEDALYHGIRSLLDDPKLLAEYKEKARQRGKMFSTENTVKAVEDMLLSL